MTDDPAWWRDAVFYEVYVRSFADSDGDGVGDLRGVIEHLDHLSQLGVDALWLTPFFPSPGADHGYDVSDYCDVDPRLGALADVDALLDAAHARGLRVVVDIVPNHTSDRHPWFQGDRSRYVTVADDRGATPPNNWPSYFGGPAWTYDADRGHHYLHLFAPGQPDLDWHDPDVVGAFDEILRFWLDRGVDGFRIDVAFALVKDRDLSDELAIPDPMPFLSDWRRAVDQPEVHDVYRRWRALLDGYPGDRVLIGEVALGDPARVARYLRDDELDMAFNFGFLFTDWDARALRESIDVSLRVLPVATWVLENHDVTRIVARIGERAARAAALLLLALPGPVFLYQGQELGLDEAPIPDAARQDPVFARTGGRRLGRDGSRVPLPWTARPPTRSWLPAPDGWGERSVEAQRADPGSFLALYRELLAVRPHGDFRWRDAPAGVVAFDRGATTCVVNVEGPPVELDRVAPGAEVVARSEPFEGALPAGAAAWLDRAAH